MLTLLVSLIRLVFSTPDAGWRKPFSSGLRAEGAIHVKIADPKGLRHPAKDRQLRALGFSGKVKLALAWPVEAPATANPTGQLHSVVVRSMLSVGRESKKEIPCKMCPPESREESC